MKAMNRAADWFLKAVMGSSSLILFVVTFLQVVFRFAFKAPLAWSQDIIRLCFTYLVFLGAAYCVRENAHLNIDVLLTSLKVKYQRILQITIQVILLAFFVFLIYYGVLFAMSGAKQTAPYLPLPMSLYYMSVPLSAAFMFFYMIQQLVALIQNFSAPEQKEDAQ
ncbi:MAG: TRAP transporter small permease [Clostridiales bacterium]